MVSRRQEQPRSPPLDGIRALAVMGVLLFHISPATLKGGFTGVDVFFVLSGFLITTIILQDMRDGAFSLLDFYLRRIQRLLPNVLVTVLAVVVLWAIFMPPMAVQTGRHGLWTIFNLSNFYIWRNLGGYWDDASSWAPLLHTWSLAVEEQFYLLYPIALLLLYRLGKARPIAWLAAAVLLSFGLCVYASRAHPAANFYMLPTRLWELVLGGMLAAYRAGVPGIAPRPLLQGPKTREIVGWAGLCCILGGFAFINEEAGFPGVVALVPTLGTAMVLASVADGSTRVSRLLSARLIVGVGALSYSLYLWHWPLITLGKFHADLHGEPQLVGATLGAVAGGLLACLAFVGVEKPLRSRDPGRARRFAIIAGLLCAVAIVSAFVGHRHTIPDPEHTFDSPSFHGFLYSAGKSVDPAKLSSASKFRDVYFPPSPPRADDAWRTGGIVRLYGGGTPRVVVMGHGRLPRLDVLKGHRRYLQDVGIIGCIFGRRPDARFLLRPGQRKIPQCGRSHRIRRSPEKMAEGMASRCATCHRPDGRIYQRLERFRLKIAVLPRGGEPIDGSRLTRRTSSGSEMG
jgi:peptidoglycan/LPS O-acetylase OafA/YrhL